MENKYLKNPFLLLDLGFVDISEESTDFVRTILFERVLHSRGIKFRAHFTQYISDAAGASYSENNRFDFEEFTMCVSREFNPDGAPFVSEGTRDLIKGLFTKSNGLSSIVERDLLNMYAESSRLGSWSESHTINVDSVEEFMKLLALLGE